MILVMVQVSILWLNTNHHLHLEKEVTAQHESYISNILRSLNPHVIFIQVNSSLLCSVPFWIMILCNEVTCNVIFINFFYKVEYSELFILFLEVDICVLCLKYEVKKIRYFDFLFYNQLKGDDVFPSTPKSDRYTSGQEMHLLQYEGGNNASRKLHLDK